MSFDIQTRLADAWPTGQWRDVTVLLAVSGGSDSVALFRAMASLKRGGVGGLRVAHFNHALRGNESDADEAFVVDLCRHHGVPCEVGRAVSAISSDHGGEGLEAAARQVRYDFLRRTAAQAGARYLVTGHTADDQVETILHHILRGTGIAGLSGMDRSRRLSEATTLIRPLLGFHRAELVEYLDALKQPYRTDSSNTNTRLTRNRLRHELLPWLAEQFNPAVDEALLRLGSLAGEAQAVVDRLVQNLAGQVSHDRDDIVEIDATLLVDEPRYLVRELFIHLWRARGWPMQSMGHAEWDELAEMLLADQLDVNKKMFPGGVLAERTDDRLRLWREERYGD